MKKTLKFTALLTAVLLISAIAGYCAFNYFFSNGNTSESVYSSKETPRPSAVGLTEERFSAENPIEFDYYIARLDGNMLNIYICTDGHEEFLYSIDIYVKNLSREDIRMLSGGINLYSEQELTSFIEDYTS